jgi:hypothetical protein
VIESHVSESRFGLHNTLKTHRKTLGCKRPGFFRVHYGHKGDATVKFEALSSACQIVNERLFKCVQPMPHNYKQILSAKGIRVAHNHLA